MASGSYFPGYAEDNVWYDKSDPGSMGTPQTRIWIGNDGYDNCHAILFKNITIPKQAFISTAKLKITASLDGEGGACNVKIFFNASDNPVLPTTYEEAISLSKTSSIEWNAIPSWIAETTYESPDLKSILQEIVNRDGYVEGGNILIIIENNNSDAMAAREGYCADYEGTPP